MPRIREACSVKSISYTAFSDGCGSIKFAQLYPSIDPLLLIAARQLEYGLRAFVCRYESQGLFEDSQSLDWLLSIRYGFALYGTLDGIVGRLLELHVCWN